MESPLRRPWTKEEDEALRTLVEEYGDGHWKMIAEKLKKKFKIRGRSGKQVRERWTNHIDPSIEGKPWTPSDETKLFSLQKQFGNSWKEISDRMGHTSNTVKNHFYSSIRRNLKEFNRTNKAQIPEVEEINSLLEDKEYRKVLLKPHFQYKKRTKHIYVACRKSLRNKEKVNYLEAEESDREEELSDLDHLSDSSQNSQTPNSDNDKDCETNNSPTIQTEQPTEEPYSAPPAFLYYLQPISSFPDFAEFNPWNPNLLQYFYPYAQNKPDLNSYFYLPRN